ncbi:type III restriction-modification system endonuclease [Dialister micraerophilus]|uniref:Type III restriction-modification system, res subunit n=1 Tax=Dialister micraerophilus DSM 19965 TaxID=888062 RepID=F2BWM1_9FIRM|nr:DEAD/DEAH box helicase family protein [Dialister micraerophilus]EGF14888.1 type III restriction-modification system, res subunit [Dialister micraerophilus DSM 19965]
MKFKFKAQQYQTDAVESVVNCFIGQPKKTFEYRRDVGGGNKVLIDENTMYSSDEIESDEIGFKNERLHLTDADILNNLRKVQQVNNIPLSDKLVKTSGGCSIDVEMETGTGKTYVYIKTMYELHKNYGWSKFIIVVPSIAIREGVKKSFEMTSDHFMLEYGKKIRFFVYDSKKLNEIDDFSKGIGIQVMIINMQAFNSSFNEKKSNKDARIIYSKRDEFASRRPIDVISANNPIIILDEPQKMGGDKTQKTILNFNPLFTLNYSATHKEKHNLVYALDAVDAYNQKLVKKIQVKGFTVDNLRGSDSYLYLEDIKLSSKEPPKAVLSFERRTKTTPKRIYRNCSVDDNLYELSGGMEQYKGYRISEINAIENYISFTNGIVLHIGAVTGDVSEKDLKRLQIRETIISHFEKERELFNKGIKVLSLFFIDEVAKYRMYDENGEAVNGEYGKIFEEEYKDVLPYYINSIETPYERYLKNISVSETHKGYFSIDKKTGNFVNGKISKSEGMSSDISAYDLILKNKERLLSFDEPTRFIFSHSALREGWDNPNVFQLCTLKQSSSETTKRQEVGRGLRLCVNQDGVRMDAETTGSEVHNLNRLTVVASGNYREFTEELQDEMKKNLRDRPKFADAEYFYGKIVEYNGQSHKITLNEAGDIYFYLKQNNYVDDDNKITDKYRDDVRNNVLAKVPEKLKPMESELHRLIQSIYDENAYKFIVENLNKTKIMSNDLNDNFNKKEFQELWRKINHKYTYRVKFDSEELVTNAANYINRNLFVSKLQYTIYDVEQKSDLTEDDVKVGGLFAETKIKRKVASYSPSGNVKYDLLGKIAEETVLTRRTIARILSNISDEKFEMYKANPEEFINKVSKFINEQKATMIVEHITYDILDGVYDSSIFTAEKHGTMEKAFKAKKHVQPYVFTDGLAANSVEMKFANALENGDEVLVYAKLPKGFKIPTPVGNYTPDWAITFKKGSVKHVFFVAETKGSMSSMQLRSIESAKIDCARKLFASMSNENLKYGVVNTYFDLLNIVR